MAGSPETAEPDPQPGGGGHYRRAAQDGKSKTAYDRRREQVRRAQKKHRERHENRCRALEDELHRLYGLLAEADELQGLRYENEVLRDIMIRHSIPLPVGMKPQRPSLAEVTFFTDDGHHQFLQVKMPEYDHGSSHTASQPCANGHELAYPDMHAPLGRLGNPQLQMGQASDESSYAHTPNFIQMGVDFVLSLERPCLFHTRAPDTDEPSGHAMSMQGMLLARAPEDLHDQTAWEVPAQQLAKLFELSGSLGLEGYITPVQAWNRINSRLGFPHLPLEKLEALRCAMVPYVKCYGFGALIEEQIFEDLLEEACK
ncbi:hypothetical protein N7468_003919 [Penicillium chermesinum]|uniref:BZIP domain-containing protein n=1 Tax=Penicillium chermesinum TaxID=63820 RepID=A0A9W9P7J1_9EURO|nr:uncharacterized protein N7468_003919 [Penicillium chermesinum]KAJ5239300.1 hypothetical protein N7468_003919 [Penicillium chermesinum]